MIDPRMIRPEAVAPTTEIVTPTPQYYGQGQVVGGQIQLGDVYGRLPNQSQEEYMYGNLANIANAAMGLAQIPGQLEQNQKRRDQQHDQDALNLYQIELNNIEQSSLNGESFYKYDNIEHPINNPEYKSKLELYIQEKMLGNLITPSGKAEASRLKTSILSQRNQSIDGRIEELLVEYKNEFNRFKSENILLNPVALDEAYRSDPVLSKLREQIQSYRDTDSTVYESATTQINEEEFNFARDARSYLMEESAREVTESFSVLANTLPGFLTSLQNPNLESVAEFTDWVGEVDNPQELYGLVGALPDGTVVEGMLLDRLTTYPTAKDITELMTVILDHQLKTVEMFSPEQRDTFVRAVVNSKDDQITRAASDHYNRVRERNVSAEQFARMSLHNSTVTEAGNDRYIVSSGAYTGTATEEFKGLIDNTLLNKNVGTDPKKYVTLAAQSYWVDNLGMPGAPISNRTIRNAASLLNIDEEDLFEQGYYKKDENGKTYLTDKGIRFQQDKTRELINELVKENGYKGLVKTAVGNIRANTSVMGASSLQAASIAINNQVISLVRKYFPLDQSITNNDILKTFSLVTDLEQEPSQALLSVMGPDYSSGIKSEVKAILDAWAESAETTSVSSSGSTANSWIDTAKPLNSPKLKAEALYYLERILTNPDRVQEAIEEEWERLITIGGHNEASIAKLHQAAMDLHRRTYTGNISLQSLSRVGLIDPNITVSVEDLANFDLNKVTNPRNLLVDPKYFDRNTFKFTQEGAVAWAAYTNQLFHGPLVSENSENALKDFIEAVSFLEEGARPEEQGIYLIALSSFIRSSQQASSTGIEARHSQSGLTSIKEVALPDGTIVPLEYDPTIDPQKDWNSIYGSVDERSFTLASKVALRIAKRIANVPDEEINSPQKIQEVIRSETIFFAGALAVSRDDEANFSRSNNQTLTSGLPENSNLRKTKDDLTRVYSPKTFNDAFRNHTSNPEREMLNLWGLSTGLLNLYRDPNRRMQVTLENADMIASQTTRGAIDYLQRTNSNMQVIVPIELAEAWNADSLNNSDEILEGTRLKLWSPNPDEITIQTLLGYMERSNNLDGVHKIPLLREIMDRYRVGLNTSSPGDPNNLIQLVGMTSYLSDRNSIPYPPDENIYENSIRLNDLALLMTPETILGNNQIRFRNFNGNYEEDSMTSYIIPDSYPTSLSISGQATDRNGNIMFANPGNRLASEFLESTPNTSNNPEEYARARLDWVIKTIPGFE